MSDEPLNPAAFPRTADPSVKIAGNDGMTLRDWFAGQALAGFAGSHHASEATWEDRRVAASCYEVADAILVARKEPSHAG